MGHNLEKNPQYLELQPTTRVVFSAFHFKL